MKKVFYLLGLSAFLCWFTPALAQSPNNNCTGNCDTTCNAKGLFETHLLTSSQRSECIACYNDVSRCAVKPLTREQCEALFQKSDDDEENEEMNSRCSQPLYFYNGSFTSSCPRYNPPCNTGSWVAQVQVARDRDALRMQEAIAIRATATAQSLQCSKLLQANTGCYGHCWNNWRYECTGNRILDVHICTNGALSTEKAICIMNPSIPDDPTSIYGNYEYTYSRNCNIYSEYTKACLAPKPRNSDYQMTDNISGTQCFQHSGITDFGGIYQCDNSTANLVRDNSSAICGFGNMTGYRKWQCNEIPGTGLLYPHEYDDVVLSEYAFHAGFQADNDTMIGNAGLDGFRCGRISQVTPPHWQVVDGSAYAELDLGRVEAVRSDPATKCAAPATESTIMTAAVRQTGSETGFAVKRQGYEYFLGLVDNSILPVCDEQVIADPTDMDVISDAKACIINGNVRLSANEVLKSLVTFPEDSTNKQVIFVNGSLTIDQPIQTPVGAYLSFIVKNEVIIDKSVGDQYNDDPAGTCFNENPEDGCATATNAHIQAVVVADSITVEGDDAAADIFNTDAFCDRRLSLAGSFVSWTGNISLNRTFKGCGLEAGEASYPDCNKDHAGVTIFYRPDFLTNAPTWLKQPHTFRYTTI